MSLTKNQIEDQLKEEFLQNEVIEIYNLFYFGPECCITMDEARSRVYGQEFPQRLFEIWKKKNKK